jgi:hypothetical protein
MIALKRPDGRAMFLTRWWTTMEEDTELSLHASLPVEQDFFPPVTSQDREKSDNEAALRRRLFDLLRVLDL